MALAITIQGIDEALSHFKYRNKPALKYRLISLIRDHYDGAMDIEAVEGIDTDTLIKILWDTGDNPTAVKNRRKNLKSVKSAINNELKRLYEKGKNPEGIIIGPANTFVMSDEARNSAFEAFIREPREDGAALLGQVKEVLKILNETIATSPYFDDAGGGDDSGKLQDIKDLIRDLTSKAGLDGAEVFRTETGTSRTQPAEGAGGAEGEDVPGSGFGGRGVNGEAGSVDSGDVGGGTEEEVSGSGDSQGREGEKGTSGEGPEEVDEGEIDELLEEVDEAEVEEAASDEEPEGVDQDEVDELLEEVEETGTGDTGEENGRGDDSDGEEAGGSVDDDGSGIPGGGTEEEVSGSDDSQGEEGEKETSGEGPEEVDEGEIDELLEEVEDAGPGDAEGGGVPEGDAGAEKDGAGEQGPGFGGSLGEEIEEIALDEELEEVDEEEIDELLEEIEETGVEEEAGSAGGASFDIPNGGSGSTVNEEERARLLAEQFNESLAAMDKFYNRYLLIAEDNYTIGSGISVKNGNIERVVHLLPFYMGKFPITNVLFEIFVEETGYKTTAERVGYGTVFHGRHVGKKTNEGDTVMTISCNSTLSVKVVQGACWYQPFGPGSTLYGKRSHPVVQVSLEDAMAFAAWTGKRLPTEEEWEAASRTSSGHPFPWGEEWQDNACNIEESLIGDTTPVDKYAAFENECGIADTLGNVLEWTVTRSKEPEQEKGLYIAKGGSFISGNGIRLFDRTVLQSQYHSNILGFRCVAY